MTKDQKNSVNYIKPPSDPLSFVFTPEVINKWQRLCNPSEDLQNRLDVINACGPYPSDRSKAANIRYRRAYKAAWDTYLFAAFACGMFNGNKRNDLLARMQSIDDNDFRSAMSECMACWFLAGKMKLSVNPVAPGRKRRNLELQINLGNGVIGVEVKAPYIETPKPAPGQNTSIWYGDDSRKIEQSISAANKQFNDDCPNLLIIAPQLRVPLYAHRHDILRAAYGQSKITWKIDTRTGLTVGPIEPKFFPEGRFLNPNRENGKLLKPDGFPAHRRISAIITIEQVVKQKYPYPNPAILLVDEGRGERWNYFQKAVELHYSKENSMWVEHYVLVLHNPYAYHPIEQNIFGQFPQLITNGDLLEWTDGTPINV